MPYYWFSSGSFNCSRLQSEWSEDDFVKLKEISALNQKYVKNEYLVLENHLYALDREKRKLADVTDSSIQFGGEWLAKTAEKVFWDSKVTPEAIETVCNLEPVAYYIWSDRFSKLAVCDINKDGTDDYVAVLVEQKRSKLAGEEIPSSECICLYLSERKDRKSVV